MSSFLRYYMPGAPTATPGARSLSDALRGISEDRMQREQMAAQAEQQRLLREHTAGQNALRRTFDAEQQRGRITAENERARLNREAADSRDLRTRRWTVRDKIQGARMGMDPMALRSLTPAAAEVGIEIGPPQPDVSQAPQIAQRGLRMDPVSGDIAMRPRPPGGTVDPFEDETRRESLDAAVQDRVDWREKAEGEAAQRFAQGEIEIREGDKAEIYNPKDVAAAHAEDAARLKGIAGQAEVPGGRLENVEKRRKEVFTARVPVYRQMGLAEADAVAKAQVDANKAADDLAADMAAGKRATTLPPDRPRYTDNSVRAYASGVENSFKVPKAREAMQQANEAIQLIQGAKRTGLKDRVALGRIRKALFGAQQSDREGAYVMNSGGLQTRVENAIKALDNGRWSESFANDILDLSHEIAVANEKHISRARDALVNRLGTSTDPNIQALDHQEVANGYFGVGGKRKAEQSAQKPAGDAKSLLEQYKALKAKKKGKK